jgi:hypothetical protein
MRRLQTFVPRPGMGTFDPFRTFGPGLSNRDYSSAVGPATDRFTSQGRYVNFQLAVVAVSRQMFQEILMLIARRRR